MYQGEAIMEFLQQEMWEQLPAIPWMDNQTLEEAGDKLQALTHHVGYFHRVTDPQALEGAWAHIVSNIIYYIRCAPPPPTILAEF